MNPAADSGLFSPELLPPARRAADCHGHDGRDYDDDDEEEEVDDVDDDWKKIEEILGRVLE